MADQQQGNALAALFPNPPTFYEHFTTENISRIEELRSTQECNLSSELTERSNPDTASSFQLPVQLYDLPSELRFLQPPEPPEEGKYRSFGDIYNLSEALPSLAEQNISQLYTPPSSPSPNSSGPAPHHDRALTLKRLSKSLLLNFLELMGTMSIAPASYAEKIEDLRTLFINFHHLLNEYRPHQARESLITLMEGQLERVRAETEGIRSLRGKVNEVLGGLDEVGNSEVPVAEVARNGAEAEDDEKEMELIDREIWGEMEREFCSAK